MSQVINVLKLTNYNNENYNVTKGTLVFFLYDDLLIRNYNISNGFLWLKDCIKIGFFSKYFYRYIEIVIVFYSKNKTFSTQSLPIDKKFLNEIQDLIIKNHEKIFNPYESPLMSHI